MEPLTLASSLATLVGLIINYRQEKGAQKTQDHHDFVEWLDYHRHEKLKGLILSSTDIQEEINRLLKQNHEELSGKMDVVREMLATILSKIEGFQGLARAASGNSELSDQAFEVLKAFVGSGSSIIIPSPSQDGYSLVLDRGGEMTPDEPQFIEDDLKTLVEYGLLRTDYNGGGVEIYRLTRRAVNYVKAAGKA